MDRETTTPPNGASSGAGGLTMADLRSGVAGYSWRRIVFTVLVLLPLLLYFGLFGFWRNQALLVTSWFGGVGLLPPIFHHPAHRLHEFAAAIMFWPLVIGLLSQLRSPTRHVAGMLMALVSIVGVLLAIAATGGWDLVPIIAFLGVPTLLATLVHPSGRDLLRSFSLDQLNKVTLVLLVIAAVPLLAFTANQVGLQTGAIEPAHDHAGAGHDEEVHAQHVEHHHFMFVVAFVLAVLGTALLASFQLPGWWLSAWVAGLMVVVYAIGGLGVPEAASNPGLLWNLAAIGWAVVFVGAAEYTQDAAAPSLLETRRTSPTSD